MPSDHETAGTLEVSSVAQALHLLERAHRRFHGQAARRLMLSETDLTALLFMGDSEKPSPGSLAHELGLTSGAITALVDRLEHAGFIRRVRDSADRRRLGLILTPKGRRAYESLRATYLGTIEETGAQEDLRSVIAPIVKMAAALDKSHLSAGFHRGPDHSSVTGGDAEAGISGRSQTGKRASGR